MFEIFEVGLTSQAYQIFKARKKKMEIVEACRISFEQWEDEGNYGKMLIFYTKKFLTALFVCFFLAFPPHYKFIDSPMLFEEFIDEILEISWAENEAQILVACLSFKQ